MRKRDKYEPRYIERVISKQNISSCDELERVVRAIVAVKCDIEMIEDSLGAGFDSSIEAGSQVWENLCHALVGYLIEDSGESAIVLECPDYEVLYDAWRCFVQDSEDGGREPSAFIGAAVVYLVDELRHGNHDAADLACSLYHIANNAHHNKQAQ